MSLAEREALSGLITTLLVVVLFAVRLSGQAAEGAFDGPDAVQVWARSVLVLVGLSILLAIGVTVVQAIVLRLVTGEPPEDGPKDERDRAIDLRALRVVFYILSFGILGIVVALALGVPVFTALNLLLALTALTEMTKDALKLVLYRTGL